MANTIQLKRSAVPAKVPTTGDLALGELAINTYDGNLFIKKNNGSDSIVKIANADLSNVAPSSAGILVSTGSGLAYRSIAGDGVAISVTLADGTSGNPTVQFNPAVVSLSLFSGGINSILPNQTGNSGKFLTTNGSSSRWATVSASPAGSSGNVQYNSDGSLAGAANVDISSSGDLAIQTSASPAVTSGDTLIYRGSFPYPTPTVMHSSMGISSSNFASLQPSIGSKDIGWWNPPGNGTAVPGVLGITAPTATGTATARTTATTTAVTRTRRLGYVSSAAINSGAGQSWTVRQWSLGDGAGLGGFYLSYMFAISDASLVATGRWTFVGMTNQSGPLTSLPTASCFGLIQDVGGTNYKIRYAGGSVGTDVDLGTNFPVDLTSVYEVRLFNSAFDTNTLYYEVIRLNTGHVARGSVSIASLSPSSSTLLGPQAMRYTGATQATAVGIDICHMYIEKNF